MLTNQGPVVKVDIQDHEQGKNRLFSALAVLVSLVVVVGIGWLLLMIVQAVIPVLSAIFLVAAFFLYTKVLFSKRTVYSVEDRKKTLRQKMYDDSKKNTKPGAELDEKTTNKYMNILALVIWGLILLLYVFLAMSFSSFALNAKFQGYPLNILGFAATALVVWSVLRILPGLFRYFQQLDQPVKNETWWGYAFSKIQALVIDGYIIGVFLVIFGIVH